MISHYIFLAKSINKNEKTIKIRRKKREEKRDRKKKCLSSYQKVPIIIDIRTMYKH